ncbi:conserved hypothetical protein [Gloeothece citriformis PCC 7424]|uniref:Late competence development protein ComFB n=1 Tax=Gloeothece citriformis (strain PCC 7424) TaxID=65393 RepID=B7K9K3_GLOC7|nr:late competence development ComFB family protein [Gloeothece citriformis]ACK69971.1 conserved hypothetical protein [Gloeothece citriformis PCC 7424]
MQNLKQPETLQLNNPVGIRQNIMELLVKQEIEKQLKHYSPQLKPYINKIEVATFALNRLPALYASTIQGKNHQIELAKKYQEQITLAVRRGIAAVERDPLRSSTPLISDVEIEYNKAKKALQDLQDYLQQKGLLSHSYLGWNNLVITVHLALKKVSWFKQLKSQSQRN